MRTLLAVVLILAGCAKSPIPASTVTPEGVPVAIREDVTESDRVTILAWVDLRLEEWVRNKSAWGCDAFTDDEMRFLAKSKTVIVYPGYFLPGRSATMGFNYTDRPEIDVAIDWPPLVLNDSLYNGIGIGIVTFDYSFGLRELPHEWTHTARGEWHP